MQKLEEYANAFQQWGAPQLLRVFSVLDTKKQFVCWPDQNQWSVYSGHKRAHYIKYHTLEGPDGLIIHCTPCADGHHGDGFILWQSGLLDYLHWHDLFLGFVVFGDSAYPNNDVRQVLSRVVLYQQQPKDLKMWWHHWAHVLSGDMRKLSTIGPLLILRNKWSYKVCMWKPCGTLLCFSLIHSIVHMDQTRFQSTLPSPLQHSKNF